MGIPEQCGMPPLDQNIEGLRSHALLVSIFAVGPEVSEAKRKWRSWLVHCLLKAARHYGMARNLIQAQIAEAHRSSEELAKGRLLPMLDFALEMEDCITSLDKAVKCVRGLARHDHTSATHLQAVEAEANCLGKFRDQQEHMHVQIASGQSGAGPIFVGVSRDGASIEFRRLTMTFDGLHRLINALYLEIASFFPGFDPSSPPKPGGGVPRLSITGTITVIPGDPNRQQDHLPEKSAMSTVHFPQVDPVPAGNTTLAFPVVIDGIQASAEISAEALQDHFGAASWQAADLISAFIGNRAAIEAVGRAKLPARQAAGRALLVTGDF